MNLDEDPYLLGLHFELYTERRYALFRPPHELARLKAHVREKLKPEVLQAASAEPHALQGMAFDGEIEEIDPFFSVLGSLGDEAHTETLSVLKPDFFSQVISPDLAEQTRPQITKKLRIASLVNRAEMAFTYWFLAKSLPRSSEAFMSGCRRLSEELDARLLEWGHSSKREQACVQAALTGHEAVLKFVEHGINYLSTLAPVGGWKNQVHAAEVVGTLLAQAGKQMNYRGSRDSQTLSLFMHDLMRKHHKAKEAFDKHRALRQRAGKSAGTVR